MADEQSRRELHRQFETMRERDPAAEHVLRLAVETLELEGECRRAEPYAQVRLVMTDSGLEWCCTHTPEHCAPAATDLKP